MKISPVGSPPDAPLRLRLIFGEMLAEVVEPFAEYKGWLSSSWLQEEIVAIDILSAELNLLLNGYLGGYFFGRRFT